MSYRSTTAGRRIGGRGVDLVAALLAVEIAVFVIAGAVLGVKTFLRSPRLNQCAVHREVFVTHVSLDLLVDFSTASVSLRTARNG